MNESRVEPVDIVIIDDDQRVLTFLRSVLRDAGYSVLTCSDPHAGIQLVAQRTPALVVLDQVMPEMNGLEALDRILSVAPGTEVVLLTGNYTIEAAVEAIRKGAADYFTKPVNLPRFRQRVAQLITEARNRLRLASPGSDFVPVTEFEGMVGRSPAMRELFSRIDRLAPHLQTALITGPTGSGKELVARALHRRGPVAEKRFVAFNSGAVVESLLESELFGHVRGAFTGASRDKVGLFEYADGGTVFLDEIGDMPLSAQARLLRVIQEREVQRVGSPAVRTVNVRVIAATHRDLRAMVEAGRFREDLYYRISMIEIAVPPLSQRLEDLPVLVAHFSRKYAAMLGKPIMELSGEAQALLARHSWPGNVRELENVIGHAYTFAAGPCIGVSDLPLRIREERSASREDSLPTLDELERGHIERVLEATRGNKEQAARILGISRATLYRILERWSRTSKRDAKAGERGASA